VPQKYEEDPPLGMWVQTQRTRFKNGKMDQERTQKLGDIGFEFVHEDRAKANEDIWGFQFKKLREYYEKHGHCELLWPVDCYTFLLNAPTNTPPVSLPELQAMCHAVAGLTHNWAIGSAISVNASKMA
jgi:hypothetical protein